MRKAQPEPINANHGNDAMKSTIADLIMSCAVLCLEHSVANLRTARLAYRLGFGLEGVSLVLNGNWAALAERQNEQREQRKQREQQREAQWRASSAA